MGHRNFFAETRERRLQLEDAAGITGGNDIGSEMGNEFGFAIAKGLRCVGLHEVVDSCGTAADGGFGDFGEFESGDARKQSARLGTHALSVLQMAGIVESHAQF